MTIPYFTSTELTLSCNCIDLSAYTDAQKDCAIMNVTMMIDAFLGQSIKKQNVTEEIQVIPNDIGGFHIQLPNRFINVVNSLSVRQSLDSSTINITNFTINKKDGYIETRAGACGCSKQYCEANGIIYIATVEYEFGLDPLPADFVKVFCDLIKSNISGNTVSTGSGCSAVSGKLKRYKLLNEEVEYESSSTTTSAVTINESWMESILSKYRFEIAMSGMAVG